MIISRLKTTDEFIAEAQQIHKDLYTYEFLKYKSAHQKVIVTCRKHGNFEITPDKHRSGRGCAKCKAVNFGNHWRGNLQDSLNECIKVHGGKYDYSLVPEYKHKEEKINVTCNIHGIFPVTWNNHKSGSGCPKCARVDVGNALRGNLKDSLNECIKVHTNKYNYSLIKDYTSKLQKINIICDIHGIFKTTWDNHKRGRGCPMCSSYGYNKGKPGTFYILTSNNLTKVGITNRSVKRRVNEINSRSHKDFAIHTTIFCEDGTKAYNIEQQVLSWLRTNHTPVTQSFDGSTECFVDVPINDLLSFIAPISTVSSIVETI